MAGSCCARAQTLRGKLVRTTEKVGAGQGMRAAARACTRQVQQRRAPKVVLRSAPTRTGSSGPYVHEKNRRRRAANRKPHGLRRRRAANRKRALRTHDERASVQYVVYPKESSRSDLHELSAAARARKPS
jgi:hypothetical protein